ncbi:unnamed protein product [Amoebophrya sp. A25]|nr:unnamed protein product [Amoebophrya sp. A25]|eukprot:GSA25T00003923001.1
MSSGTQQVSPLKKGRVELRITEYTGTSTSSSTGLLHSPGRQDNQDFKSRLQLFGWGDNSSKQRLHHEQDDKARGGLGLGQEAGVEMNKDTQQMSQLHVLHHLAGNAEATLFLKSCSKNRPFFVGRNLLFREEDEEAEEFSQPTAIDLDEFQNVKVAALGCGDQHFLALTEEGLVFSWACSNEFGQCGRGVVSTKKSLPNLVPFSTSAWTRPADAGTTTSTSSVALQHDHQRTSAGPGPSSTTPLKNALSASLGLLGSELHFTNRAFRAKQVACGENHSLILTEAGEVFAFGSNVLGQCGVYYSTSDLKTGIQSYAKTPGNESSSTRGVILNETLTPNFYVLEDGVDVMKDGNGNGGTSNASGGRGGAPLTSGISSPPLTISSPVRVEGKLNAMPVRQIACGRQHSLAVTISGTALSWGSNKRGQLGNRSAGGGGASGRPRSSSTNNGSSSLLNKEKTTTAFFHPVVVDLPSSCRLVAGGGQHSAFVLKTGQLFLCGDNSNGQLGQSVEDVFSSAIPLEVLFGKAYDLQVRAVSLGDRHSVAVSLDSRIFAWGRNVEGQVLGMSKEVSSSPAAVVEDEEDVEREIDEVLSPRLSGLKLDEDGKAPEAMLKLAAANVASKEKDDDDVKMGSDSNPVISSSSTYVVAPDEDNVSVDYVEAPVHVPLEALCKPDTLMIREVFAVADHTIVVAEVVAEHDQQGTGSAGSTTRGRGGVGAATNIRATAPASCMVPGGEQEEIQEQGKSPTTLSARPKRLAGEEPDGKRRRIDGHDRLSSFDAAAAEDFRALAKEALISAMSSSSRAGDQPGSGDQNSKQSSPVQDLGSKEQSTLMSADKQVVDAFLAASQDPSSVPQKRKTPPAELQDIEDLFVRRPSRGKSEGGRSLRGSFASTSSGGPALVKQEDIFHPAPSRVFQHQQSTSSLSAPAEDPGVFGGATSSELIPASSGGLVLTNFQPAVAEVAASSCSANQLEGSLRPLAAARSESERFLPREHSRGCTSEQAESIKLHKAAQRTSKKLTLLGNADNIAFYSLDNSFFHNAAATLAYPGREVLFHGSGLRGVNVQLGTEHGGAAVGSTFKAPLGGSSFFPASILPQKLLEETKTFQAALLGAFSCPSVLSCCFVFKGLQLPKIDVDGFISGTAQVWNLASAARHLMLAEDLDLASPPGGPSPRVNAPSDEAKKSNKQHESSPNTQQQEEDVEMISRMDARIVTSPLDRVVEDDEAVEPLGRKQSAHCHFAEALVEEKDVEDADPDVVPETVIGSSKPSDVQSTTSRAAEAKWRQDWEKNVQLLERTVFDQWLLSVQAGLEKMQPSNLVHRDQLRPLVLYLLSPVWQAAGAVLAVDDGEDADGGDHHGKEHLRTGAGGNIGMIGGPAAVSSRAGSILGGGGGIWVGGRIPSLVDITRRSKTGSMSRSGSNAVVHHLEEQQVIELDREQSQGDLTRDTTGVTGSSDAGGVGPTQQVEQGEKNEDNGNKSVLGFSGDTPAPGGDNDVRPAPGGDNDVLVTKKTEELRSHFESIEKRREDALIAVFKLLLKTIMWLPKAAKREFLNIMSQELTAAAFESRLLANLHRMASIIFFKPGHFKERAVHTGDGREAYVLNIDETVWYLVQLFDMVYVAALPYMHRGKIKREAFHLKLLLEEKPGINVRNTGTAGGSERATTGSERTTTGSEGANTVDQQQGGTAPTGGANGNLAGAGATGQGAAAPGAAASSSGAGGNNPRSRNLHRSPSSESGGQMNEGGPPLSPTLVPPEADLYMFSQYCRKKALSLKSIDDACFDFDKKNQFCGVPRSIMSFIAHPHLCPTRYKQRVLEVENSMMHQIAAQHSMQRGVLMNLATGAGMLNPQTLTRDAIMQMVHFVLEVRRDHLVHDAFRILESAGEDLLIRPLKVKFTGEEGLDDGGLTKEFFRLLSSDIFSPAYGMFQEVEGTRAIWFNLSAFDVGLTEGDFRSVGKIIGLSIYNNVQGINMNFPRVFFKKLVGEPVTRPDLEQIYPSYATSIDAILHWRPSPPDVNVQTANEQFEDIFCLDFSVSYKNAFDQDITVELIEHGLQKNVNYENREQFVELLTEYLLEKQAAKLFEPLKEGFRQVCNNAHSAIANTLFSDELSLLICGERVYDFDALRAGTTYVGFSPEDPYIRQFWSVLRNYPLELKRDFLDFVTGSDIPPMGGLKELKLKIHKNGDEPTTRLPTSHTCYNILLLPHYSSRSKLDYLLRIAIANAEGFGME